MSSPHIPSHKKRARKHSIAKASVSSESVPVDSIPSSSAPSESGPSANVSKVDAPSVKVAGEKVPIVLMHRVTASDVDSSSRNAPVKIFPEKSGSFSNASSINASRIEVPSSGTSFRSVPCANAPVNVCPGTSSSYFGRAPCVSAPRAFVPCPSFVNATRAGVPVFSYPYGRMPFLNHPSVGDVPFVNNYFGDTPYGNTSRAGVPTLNSSFGSASFGNNLMPSMCHLCGSFPCVCYFNSSRMMAPSSISFENMPGTSRASVTSPRPCCSASCVGVSGADMSCTNGRFGITACVDADVPSPNVPVESVPPANSSSLTTTGVSISNRRNGSQSDHQIHSAFQERQKLALKNRLKQNVLHLNCNGNVGSNVMSYTHNRDSKKSRFPLWWFPLDVVEGHRFFVPREMIFPDDPCPDVPPCKRYVGSPGAEVCKESYYLQKVYSEDNIVSLSGKSLYSVGNSMEDNVFINSNYVDAQHAELYYIDHGLKEYTGFYIRAVSEKYCTHLNGKHLLRMKYMKLEVGDILDFGTTDNKYIFLGPRQKENFMIYQV